LLVGDLLQSSFGFSVQQLANKKSTKALQEPQNQPQSGARGNLFHQYVLHVLANVVSGQFTQLERRVVRPASASSLPFSWLGETGRSNNRADG
jgi:hypothetical protein